MLTLFMAPENGSTLEIGPWSWGGFLNSSSIQLHVYWTSAGLSFFNFISAELNYEFLWNMFGSRWICLLFFWAVSVLCVYQKIYFVPKLTLANFKFMFLVLTTLFQIWICKLFILITPPPRSNTTASSVPSSFILCLFQDFHIYTSSRSALHYSFVNFHIHKRRSLLVFSSLLIFSFWNFSPRLWVVALVIRFAPQVWLVWLAC